MILLQVLGTFLVLTHFILFMALLECKFSISQTQKKVNIVKKLSLSLSLSLSPKSLLKSNNITEIQRHDGATVT